MRYRRRQSRHRKRSLRASECIVLHARKRHRRLTWNSNVRPSERAVILLPLHDFILLNTVFNAILLEPLISPSTTSHPDQSSTKQNSIRDAPAAHLLHTFLSLSSYILTHASSVQSERAAAYAKLCLATLLHLVENDVAMSALVQPVSGSGLEGRVRICRQVSTKTNIF